MRLSVKAGDPRTVRCRMKIDEFEFIETVNALSIVIGLSVASAPPELQAAFVGRLDALIASTEPNSIRWRVYRQIMRDVGGEVGEDPNAAY